MIIYKTKIQQEVNQRADVLHTVCFPACLLEICAKCAEGQCRNFFPGLLCMHEFFFHLIFPSMKFFFCTFWFLSSRGFGLRPKMCQQRKFPLRARKTSSTQGIGPLKIQKNTGLLIFNSLKQKKLIFNFFVHRN